MLSASNMKDSVRINLIYLIYLSYILESLFKLGGCRADYCVTFEGPSAEADFFCHNS